MLNETMHDFQIHLVFIILFSKLIIIPAHLTNTIESTSLNNIRIKSIFLRKKIQHMSLHLNQLIQFFNSDLQKLNIRIFYRKIIDISPLKTF